MTFGAEPKKVALLGGLVVAIAGIYIYNSSSDPAPVTSTRVISTPVPEAATGAVRQARTPGRPAISDFHVRVLGNRPDDKVDPASIDPELRLDLLAKVQAVPPIDAGRNLFQFGPAPAPDTPIPAVPKNVAQIPIAHPIAPPPTAIAPTGPPPPPPVQPINLKYYGIMVRKTDGRKRAFLQDGDDILFAQENQVVKQRYRIVKIAPTTIDIEDLQAKNTQTLKLQDLPPS